MHIQFRPRKKLGQCFLVDRRVLAREAKYAHCEGELVLEVGAGRGELTRYLAQEAEKVIAVEKDARLIPILRANMAAFPNVEIVHADFLEYDAPRVDVVASNVPYSISSPLTFKLAAMDFGQAVLCYQKEFAGRMLAQPGERERSRLSVMAQLHFEIKFLERVPRTAFRPKPKVDSMVLELRPKGFRASRFQAEAINALFQHKNKKVRASFVDSRGMFGLSKEKARGIADRLQLRERKVYDLTNEEVVGACDEISRFLANAK